MATQRKSAKPAASTEGTPAAESPAVPEAPKDEQAPESTTPPVRDEEEPEPTEAEMLGEDIDDEGAPVEPPAAEATHEVEPVQETSTSVAEFEAMLEKVAAEKPSLIAKFQRLLGITESDHDSSKDKEAAQQLYSRISGLPINPYFVARLDREEAAKLCGVDVKQMMAWTCRGGMPDDNQVVEDPQVYVSCVTRDGQHHAAPVPNTGA